MNHLPGSWSASQLELSLAVAWARGPAVAWDGAPVRAAAQVMAASARVAWVLAMAKAVRFPGGFDSYPDFFGRQASCLCIDAHQNRDAAGTDVGDRTSPGICRVGSSRFRDVMVKVRTRNRSRCCPEQCRQCLHPGRERCASKVHLPLRCHRPKVQVPQAMSPRLQEEG